MNAPHPVILEQQLNRPPKEAEVPIRGDRVSNDRYTCTDYLKREFTNVWHTVWNIGGVSYQMPEPGDYLTTELGMDSILMVRQEDGSIKAFFNSCPHRGARVTEAEDGHAKAFSCPYHGWQFDRAGVVTQVPDEEDFAESERLLEHYGFVVNYVFKYSPRPDTAAHERFPDDVPEETKKERNRRLLAASERAGLARHRARLGGLERVFVEDLSQRRVAVDVSVVQPRARAELGVGARPRVEQVERPCGGELTSSSVMSEESEQGRSHPSAGADEQAAHGMLRGHPPKHIHSLAGRVDPSRAPDPVP